MKPKTGLRLVAENLGVSLIYFALGKIGFSLAALHATPVWPPAGFALACLLLRGYSILPGIWLGAWLVNFWPPMDSTRILASCLTLAGTSTAAVLGGYAAAHLVKRFAHGAQFLDRARDVIRFAILGALLGATLSATIGTLSLFLGKFVTPHDFEQTWFTWWLGDSVGYFVFTPLIIAWRDFGEQDWHAHWFPEALLLVAVLYAVGVLAFGGIVPSHYAIEYMMIPVVVAAAFRFGRKGATAAVLLISSIAIWGSIHGAGPFSLGTQNESLLALQSFLGVIAMTGIVLSSVLAERAQRARDLIRAMKDAEEARSQAEEANRAKSSFLFSMNHELRTPLNHIIGYSDLLQEDAKEQGEDHMIPDLQKINEAGKNLSRMVGDILDLSALETGKMFLEISEFDLESLVSEIDANLRSLAEQNENQLDVHCSADLGKMHSDQTRVKQVLWNVAHNACKFTNKGRVSLEISREHTNGNDSVKCVIADSGIGMSSEQLNRLFRPFTQADSSPTRRYGGSGLGLAISNLFCQRMGGNITVISEEGKGSTFTIHLPARI